MMNKEQAVQISKTLGELFTQLSTVCGQFNELAMAMGEEVKDVLPKKEEVKVEAPKKEKEVKEVVKAPTTEEETEVETEVDYKAEYLALPITELRAMAKKKGLKTNGSKVALVDRLLGEEAPEEPKKEEPKKEVKKVEVPVAEETEEVEALLDEEEEEEALLDEEEEEEEEVEADEVEETLSDKVTRELEEYTDEEIREVLEDIDKPSKGKRQALISRIVEAVEEGLLSFDDEEEAEEDENGLEVDIDNTEEELEIVEESDEEEEETEEETPRQEAMNNIANNIQQKYAKKKLTDNEIAKFLDEHFNGKFKAEDKKRALAKYMEVHTSLVDDDGDVSDFANPYYVNEEAYCCGTELEELDNGNLFCQHCANEYETE